MVSNEERNQSNVPENNPSNAMDSGRKVENSPDEKTDEDFPGYPHYPAKEDIMDQRTGSHRVDADLENADSGQNASGVSQRFESTQDDENARNEEIGLPQNLSNEDLGQTTSGTDIDEAAEKGSLNP